MQTQEQGNIFDYSRSSRRFVVSLRITAEQPARVLSCSLDGRSFQNRTVFDGASTIDGIFAGEIAVGLTKEITGLEHRSHVIALPDTRIEAEGVMLADLTIITKRGPCGTLDLTLRFRHLIGSFSPLFATQLGFGSNLDDHSGRLSALILTDLAMPILNLCETLQEPLTDAGAPFAKLARTLAEHSYQVKFQIELLKRFAIRSETGGSTPQRQEPFVTAALHIEKAYELGLLGKAHAVA